MAGHLKNEVLRTLEPDQIVTNLRTALQNGQTHDTISQHLIRAVAKDSLSPQCYMLWLSACSNPDPIRLGLAQTHSIWIRCAALKAFKRWFEGPRCTAVWPALGGTEGVVALMAQMSVDEVKTFCGLVRRCAGKRTAREERQSFVTGLMTALLSSYFPESKIQNPDRRPLMPYYADMVSACTPNFIDAWIEREELPNIDMAKVVKAHALAYKRRCVEAIRAGETDVSKYSSLFNGALPEISRGARRDITATMAYCREVLDTMLTQAGRNGYDLSKEGPQSIIVKALRIATRRRVPKEWSSDMTRLVVVCLKKAKESSESVGLDYEGVEDDIFRLWRRSPDLDELDDLVHMTTALSAQTPKGILYNYFDKVPKTLRYDFMRWLLRHSKPAPFDLDNIEDLKKDNMKHAWAPALFQRTLPRDEARRLFSKLREARPDGSFLRTSPRGEGTEVHMALVDVSLHDDADQAAEEASEHMHVHMKRAQESREQTLRAENAKLVLRFAVASRSLDILHEAFVWARRFNRDPLTTMEIYAPDIICSDEIVSLLAGIPVISATKSAAEAIAARVRKGNKIVLFLLETAIMCQREPSFQDSHWYHVERLFSEVVEARSHRSARLQSFLQLSDEALYPIVWQSTVEMLIQAEELGLNEDNKALDFNDIGGPLLTDGTAITIHEPSATSLRFVEELMKRRDELWRRHRPKIHPAAATLEAPWPRGLPVQALNAAFTIESKSAFTLPYLENRIESVVFAGPQLVLQPVPEDAETRAAIGCFVEEYRAALRAYVKWGGEYDRRRATKAWSHATGFLSQGRMSALEATLFWKPIFAAAGVTVGATIGPLPTRQGPSICPVGSSEDIAEWNPDNSPETLVSRNWTLDLTCMDCFVNCITDFARSDIDTPFDANQKSRVPQHRLPRFWDLDQFGRRIPAAAREGYIAAALLYAEGNANASSKLLGTSFPSIEDVRFPAMFLDQAFLDRRDFGFWDVEKVLWRLRVHTPPNLLRDLVEGLMDRFVLEPTQSAALRRWTFAMLKLLAWSDRPELALDFITEIVVGMPDESSWHRKLLHAGILKRLPASCATTLMAELKHAILTKLEMQLQRIEAQKHNDGRVNPMGSWRQALHGKRIKLTTTKLLAQILDGAIFVDEHFSVDVLVGLFERSKHLDVRIVVVESMTSMLLTTGDNKVQKTITEALEQHALPVASNINERDPVTEQDWLDAEDKDEPPELCGNENYASNIPALCACFFRAADKASDTGSTALVDQLLTRFIFPIIQTSIETYSRWTAIFLRAHGAQHLARILPSIPLSKNLLQDLLVKHSTRMPASLFQLLSTQKLIQGFPPPELEAFQYRQHSIRTPAKTFWLRLWSEESQFGFLSQCQIPAQLPEKTSPDGALLLNFELLLSHEREVIDRLLADHTRYLDEWSSYIESFNPLRQREAVFQERWEAYCKPIVEYAVSRITTLRSEARRKDAFDRPAVLPDEFPLRVWLASWPIIFQCEDEIEAERRRERFAQDVGAFIDEMVARGRPYVRHYSCLLPMAHKLPMEKRPALALHMGRLPASQSGSVSAAVLQRVEFVDGLLRDADWDVLEEKQKEVWESCLDMVEGWKECADEDARRMGWKRAKTIRARTPHRLSRLDLELL